MFENKGSRSFMILSYLNIRDGSIFNLSQYYNKILKGEMITQTSKK